MERKFREFLYLSEVKGLHPRQIQQLLLVYLEGTRQVLYGAVSGVEAQRRNDPYMLRNRRRRHGGALGVIDEETGEEGVELVLCRRCVNSNLIHIARTDSGVK
jgi:hypothetical protein